MKCYIVKAKAVYKQAHYNDIGDNEEVAIGMIPDDSNKKGILNLDLTISYLGLIQAQH